MRSGLSVHCLIANKALSGQAFDVHVEQPAFTWVKYKCDDVGTAWNDLVFDI